MEHKDAVESGQESAEALAAITKAQAEVEALCNGKHWTMTIPAREGEDSDLVIADALHKAECALLSSRSTESAEAHGEWDRRTKKEMWDTIQEIRKFTDNDGTCSPEDSVRDLIDRITESAKMVDATALRLLYNMAALNGKIPDNRDEIIVNHMAEFGYTVTENPKEGE